MESALTPLSVALLSIQKNNLDTSSHATTKHSETDVIRNNINSTECFSIDENNIVTSSPMSTDSEPYDSDDQSKPDIVYEEELPSRRIYNGQRRKNQSTPLASATMLEDLIAEVQQQHHETYAANHRSVVTWSIDNSNDSYSESYNSNEFFPVILLLKERQRRAGTDISFYLAPVLMQVNLTYGGF
ncbi:unnamed protein product [Mytilus coruscus]|uniref:Uncharacterized protein n=1 Tax=Mytilus coruscus TaxID=42192 RepID=A0A6J8BUR7_MYTCO|nr:unnamed protein product [Mytilus coruscus]